MLYGPQGTLFGRNTTGGAISIHTRGPSDELGFQQRVAYGSDNELILRSILDTGELGTSGLKGQVRLLLPADGRLAARPQHEGFDEPRLAKRQRLSWGRSMPMPAAGLTFDLRGDYRHTKYRPTAYQLVGVTQDVIDYFSRSPNYGGDPFLYSTDRKIRDKLYQNNAFPPATDESWGTSLTTNYDGGTTFNIKNVLAYRHLDLFSNNDPGGQGFLFGQVLDNATFLPAGVAPVTPLNARTTSLQHQWSDELQVSGTLGQFDYLVGAFAFTERSHGTQFVDATFVLPGGLYALNNNVGKDFRLKTNSYAVFGQLSYRPAGLDDRMEITGGLRYTRDEKSFSQTLFLNSAVTVGTSAQEELHEPQRPRLDRLQVHRSRHGLWPLRDGLQGGRIQPRHDPAAVRPGEGENLRGRPEIGPTEQHGALQRGVVLHQV